MRENFQSCLKKNSTLRATVPAGNLALIFFRFTDTLELKHSKYIALYWLLGNLLVLSCSRIARRNADLAPLGNPHTVVVKRSLRRDRIALSGPFWTAHVSLSLSFPLSSFRFQTKFSHRFTQNVDRGRLYVWKNMALIHQKKRVFCFFSPPRKFPHTHTHT